MSIAQSIKYLCSQCKRPFRYNNQCRCNMCNIKIDADTCLSCHKNNHFRGLASALVAYCIVMSNLNIVALLKVIS